MKTIRTRVRRSPWVGNCKPFQYSCLGNPMKRGVWQATVHTVTESNMTEWLSTSSETRKSFNRSSCFVRIYTNIRWSVQFSWYVMIWYSKQASLVLSGKEPTCQFRTCVFDCWARKIPWRRKWQPTPVFLLGKSHDQRSLTGYSPWNHKSVRHNSNLTTVIQRFG